MTDNHQVVGFAPKYYKSDPSILSETTQSPVDTSETSTDVGNIVHEKAEYDDSNPILKTLDNDQRIAATVSNDSVLQILAGPGTGKTTALVHRTAWLIEHYHLDPKRIILMTFTNQAAKELNERINSLLANSLSKSATPVARVKTGTFHSICLRYLAQYGKLINIEPKFTIIDSDAQKSIFHNIFKSSPVQKLAAENKFYADRKQQSFSSSDKGKVNAYTLQSLLGSIRSKCLEISDFANTVKGKDQQFSISILNLYEETKRNKNFLDFDDLLWYGAKLLQKFPNVVNDIQHVLVDEFQDTDELQYHLTKLFAQKRNNITVVGDPDQSIYSFRNATTKNFGTMRKDYPNYQRVYLTCNYRSTNDIVNLSQEVIKLDTTRVDKNRTIHANYSGPKTFGVHLIQFYSKGSEMRAIAAHIKALTLLQNNSFQYSDFAILFRFRYQISDLEFALNHASIPYKIVGARSFWNLKEIKVLMWFFLIIQSDLHEDAGIEAIKFLKIGMGEKTISSISDHNDESHPSFFSKLEGLVDGSFHLSRKLASKTAKNLASFVSNIHKCRQILDTTRSAAGLEQVFDLVCEFSDVAAIVTDESPDREQSVKRNLNLIRDKIKSLGTGSENDWDQEIVHDAENKPDYLTTFLQSSSLGYTDLEEKSPDLHSKNKVTISTMHGSKGLEWPIVFVPDLSCTLVKDIDQEAEERRIFYVSITRGKSACYLTYSDDSQPNNQYSTGISYESFLPTNISEKLLPKSEHSIPRITETDIQSTKAFLRGEKLTLENETASKSGGSFQPASTLHPTPLNNNTLPQNTSADTKSKSAVSTDMPVFGSGFASVSTMLSQSEILKASTKRPQDAKLMAPGSRNKIPVNNEASSKVTKNRRKPASKKTKNKKKC